MQNMKSQNGGTRAAGTPGLTFFVIQITFNMSNISLYAPLVRLAGRRLAVGSKE